MHLAGEMEGNEHEREEIKNLKENRPENYHVHDNQLHQKKTTEGLDHSDQVERQEEPPSQGIVTPRAST